MLQLHTLTFALWFVMVYPRAMASGNVIQKIVAFIAVVLEQMGADAHMIALVLFCQFTRNTPCTDSMDSKDVMHC